MNANLAEVLTRRAAATPDRVAVVAGPERLTYAVLDDLTARAAALLGEAGIEPGDRVAVMMPNHPAFVVAYYGALQAGAVVVPMNPLLKAREIEYYLRDPEVKLIFAWAGCGDEVVAGAADLDTLVVLLGDDALDQVFAGPGRRNDVAVREASDTAVILYTSGTTGQPKGAELTHANLGRNATMTAELFGLGPDDVVIGALPLFHSFGQTCSLNAVFSAGGSVALVPRFEPRAVLETIEREGATVFMGVPTMYSALLHEPTRAQHDSTSLRRCVSGGAALPVEVLHGFEEAFGCVLLEGYGLSETSPVASFNRPGQKKPGTIGLPADGIEMKVVDDDGSEVEPGEVGEIAIRGHNVMKGYWRRPEETAAVLDADGWFRTGDLGRIDEDGFFAIVDRKKDLVIRGGYNVYPREIEEVLYEHPAVRECAVVGLPHAGLGEEIGAAVALTEAGAATVDELRDFVKERVAAYKYPRVVWLVDELPKGPTNKILKREIALAEGAHA